jgi:hypothetical protein
MTMHPSDDDLERLVDERLSRLPVPRAPRTLLPRVMAAVARAGRPWYQRDWRAWPAVWQALSTAALVSLVLGIGLLMSSVQGHVDREVTEIVQPVVSPAGQLLERVEAIATASQVVWRVVQPVTGVLVTWILLMCAACAAFGAALKRVAFEGV